MSTKTTNSRKAVHAAGYGNACVFSDGVTLATTDIELADVIQAVYVPAGTAVHKVRLNVTDMDTNVSPTLAAKIGFTPVDGSAAPSGADTAVSAAAAFAQSAGVQSYDVIPPYLVDKDSWLNIVITTAAATAAAGSVNAVVEGEARGVK